MRYYRFQCDGFRGSYAFCQDDEAARKAGFDTAIELARSLGHLVFVTVYDSTGNVVGRLPHMLSDVMGAETANPGAGPRDARIP